MKPLNTIPHRALDWEARMGAIGTPGYGAFMLPGIGKGALACIASISDGWDHISVSMQHRCPDWAEMEYVKRLFFEDHETAMQLHVPPVDHISIHPFCLHLWRPHSMPIPRPPQWMIA